MVIRRMFMVDKWFNVNILMRVAAFTMINLGGKRNNERMTVLVGARLVLVDGRRHVLLIIETGEWN
jgi:hypothetical protein